MKDFDNKVVVITGAASGIGKALAEQFSQLGAHLALNDVNKEKLNIVARTIEGTSQSEVFAMPVDVADKTAVFDFAEKALAHFKHVDVVINNAGIAIEPLTFDKMSLERFEHLLNINLHGVIYTTKSFINALLARPEAALVNISSIFGMSGIAENEAYCTSKFAVNGFTMSLIQTYQDHPLSIHCVYPSGINTNINNNIKENGDDDERALQFGQRFLTISPEKAAQTIINGIKKGKPRILIGQDAVSLDIGLRLSSIGTMNIVNRKIKTAYNS